MIDISLYYMPHFAYPFICPWTLGWFHEFPGSRMPMYSSIKVQRCPGVRRLYLYILNIFLCMGRDNDSSSSSLSSSSFSLLCKHSYWKHCPALLFFMWLKHTHTPGLPVLHYLTEFAQTRPLSWWCHPIISSSVAPFSSCPQSLPASGSFPLSQHSASGGHSIGASALVLPMNIQGWFPLGLAGWSPCHTRDSQESSPAPQFKSINSSTLSLLYGLTLTSVHDYWQDCSFDYVDLCWQSDVFAF